jgi:trypsin
MRSAANAHFCGGFIITNNWVGCAAHCTINRAVTNTVVVVGAHHRITGGISHPASHISNHPQYNSGTLAFDISMVRVQSPIVFTASVGPIALEHDFISTFSQAQVSGWGQVRIYALEFKTLSNMQLIDLDNTSWSSC